MTTYAIDLEDVRNAEQRIRSLIHRTPLITCSSIDHVAGRSLYFKCENFQRVGAFKFRGASNAIACLNPEDAAKGVVTHSSGNHAQALARAAREHGVTAHIVMPETAPQVKQKAVAGYGGQIKLCEPTLSARETTAQAIVAATGATLIHPYDNEAVMAGQGTTGLEILADLPDLDAVVVPVGGGGLLSGICVALKSQAPHVKVIAAEPKGADDAARSFAEKRWIPQEAPQTIADGLLTSLGERTWPIIRDHIETVITVEDREIVAAMRWIWERAKLVVEPSAAVSLAAVLSSDFQPFDACRRVAVVLTGGNVNLESVSGLFAAS